MFTPKLGLRGELLYVQRGSGYNFLNEDTIVGSPYIIKERISINESFVEFGTLDMVLDFSNGYLSIPITVNYQINKRWEVFGGLSIDMLLQPTGRGRADFTSNNRPGDIFFRQSYDFNYRSNDPGELTLLQQVTNAQSDTPIIVGEEIKNIPKTISAYFNNYDLNQEIEKKYNFFDSHLTLGFNYFINSGFYLGARAEFGLTDITNNDGDFSIGQINSDATPVFNGDHDRSVSLNLSFGFRF